ncbi:TetR/AcrR family transcriptional regulator [Prauserella alba]|uniref:TetR/AcrR family transcriptional regulator n=1 Tax=Prauserella alba TaxID=176898 RepID=UPI0020A234CB|nr:TetR/AcrR family transcriptional regulator [Prauserella alba]
MTEDVRRRQIIDATIATIADLGYAKTSFARIVERADLSSTRMVSYHFAGKADLVQATLGTVVDRQDTFVAQRLGEERDLGRLLLGQLTGEVAFLAAHPRESAALVEIGTHAATADDADVSAQVVYAIRFGRLERQLAQGIRHGVFRELDPKVMALVMRQAVDGVILRLRREPDLDPDACGRELTDLFDRAVRAD